MKTIRYPDGTVRHVFGGPELQRRRRRPTGSVWFILVGLIVLYTARAGGKT